MRAALLGPLLPRVELLARLSGAAGHDDRADVRRLEHPELGVGEVVGALGELEAEAQVRLVGAVPPHRLRVGHARERQRDLVADQLPDRGDDGLGEGDHVVLLGEAHLDVELGELGLPVGAEVLVAVAAGDLEVPLQAADHEQLLEQLRALRQGVPAAGLQACRNQEVAGSFRRRPGERGRLDLDEAPGVEHLARSPVDLAAQPQRLRRSRAAQVQVAVAQPRLLADLDVVVDLEGQRGGLAQDLDGRRDDLDLTCRQVGVGVPCGPLRHLSGHPEAVLAAQPVRHALVTDDHLDDTGGVAEVEEGHTPVITPPGHPAGQRDGLADVRGTQGAGLVGAEHGGVLRIGAEAGGVARTARDAGGQPTRAVRRAAAAAGRRRAAPTCRPGQRPGRRSGCP